MIQYIKFKAYKNKTYIYSLCDSDFECEVSTPNEAWETLITKTALVATEYKKRNLPIIKNILELYNHNDYKANPLKYLKSSKAWIDKHYPELEFGSVIYPQIKMKFEIQLLLG